MAMRSQTASVPSLTKVRTASTSQRPTPATSVSWMCSSGLSSGDMTAAIPPCAHAVEPSSSQKWILVVLAVVLVEVIGFVWFHQTKVSELENQQSKNKAVEADIGTIRTLVQEHENVKKDLGVLKAREEAIKKLESARTGPTAALLELSRLLTPNKGPTVDPDRYAKQQQAARAS